MFSKNVLFNNIEQTIFLNIMTRQTLHTEEIELTKTALQALEGQTGIAHRALTVGQEPATAARGRQADGRVEFEAPLGAYVIEVKRNLPPARVGPVIAQLRGMAGTAPALLVTDHVTPAVGQVLKDGGVQFIDTAGNAYLHRDRPLVHVWIIGNKPQRELAHKPVTLFRAQGLRTVLPLLCLPKAVDAPYRQLAAWAGVSLGTVANTLEELTRLGHLRATRTGRAWADRAGLMRKWVETYPQYLRPRLKPRRFHVLYEDWWREFGRGRFERHDLWLSGEGAAALLTKYLHPELITIYGRPDFPKLAQELKAERTERANLELLEPFWNFEVPDFDAACRDHRLCPPLLVYADLVATGQARHLDAAELIKERFLDAP